MLRVLDYPDWVDLDAGSKFRSFYDINEQFCGFFLEENHEAAYMFWLDALKEQVIVCEPETYPDDFIADEWFAVCRNSDIIAYFNDRAKAEKYIQFLS